MEHNLKRNKQVMTPLGIGDSIAAKSIMRTEYFIDMSAWLVFGGQGPVRAALYGVDHAREEAR